MIKLSGEDGKKAFYTEEAGREWFGLTSGELDKVFAKIDRWISRRNGFK